MTGSKYGTYRPSSLRKPAQLTRKWHTVVAYLRPCHADWAKHSSFKAAWNDTDEGHREWLLDRLDYKLYPVALYPEHVINVDSQCADYAYKYLRILEKRLDR